MQKNKNTKNSMSENIMKIIKAEPKSAEIIKRELKDGFGHNFPLGDIRVNLLYLLRREKIKRRKENKEYKYYI